ncbi:MAG: class I adenylate-forming enzyme family protein [Steroidobacteraceae bacterium]|jgi:acyl-CoA synthetase (AMP-forming)/AMP-acid ligase II|nr:class I adenylate-forming enzyme family protein [Steroidobacteraceae bacterium]
MVAANLASVLDRGGAAEAVALVDVSGREPVSYTYAELRRMAAATAGALRRRGLGAGSRLGMLCSNTARFYAAYFGGLRAGCTVVPYNARAGAEAIGHVCADAALELLIVDAEAPAGVPASLPVVATESAEFDAWLAGEPDERVEPPGESPAIVLYTSGSTGRPKGVMLSHASQLAIVDGLAQPGVRTFLSHGPCIVAAPLFHMNGLVFSELAFAVGAQVVLMRRFEAQPFIAALDRYRVTVLSGVPTMVALLAKEREALAAANLSCVELVMIGSAPVSESIVAQTRAIFPKAAIINSYGTTEIGAGMLGAHPGGLPRPALSIGYPAPHAELRLVGGSSADEGVLEVRSRASMSGYLNLPEVTAAKLRDGWINTGDIVRRDADGFLYFVGRADDMFVCAGENVYPGEVERLIEQHPDVLEVAVVPAADEVRGQMPVAFVVTRPGAKLDEQSVKDYVLQRAAPYLHPRRVWFLERMPLSGANKIDRHVLKAQAAELVVGSSARGDSPPP